MTAPLRLELVAPSGSTIALHDLPGVLAVGASGLFQPPFELLAEDVPEQVGSRLRSVKAKTRDVTLPVLIDGGDQEALLDLLRVLAGNLDPSAGDSRLRAYRTDGSSRDLVCRYAGGLELEQTDTTFGGSWQTAGLVFRAFDPYWLGPSSSLIFGYAAPRPFFPFLPLVLGTDQISGSTTVINDGQGPSYPVWTVTGPCSRVVLSNQTTGQSLDLASVLVLGQSLVIDTRPGSKTVLRSDGASLYGDLSIGSSLWSLVAGLNVLTISVTGADVGSSVTLAYSLRYLTP